MHDCSCPSLLRGLVIGALVAALVVAVGVLASLYIGERHKLVVRRVNRKTLRTLRRPLSTTRRTRRQ